jgi:hypothetical protein
MAGLAPPATRRATIAVAALLAAGITAWAALPLHEGHAGTRPALIAAIATAVLSIAQLALSSVPLLAAPMLASAPERAAERLLRGLRAVQWPEGLLLATLVLEALHPAPPWHTGVLGVALVCYLLALHLVETRASPAVLRPQLPIIAAGLGLLALAVGAAALPGLPAGGTALLAGALALVAAVVVAALALPGTGSRRS